MAKRKNDYFELAVEQVEYCVNASSHIIELFENYSVERVLEYKQKIHSIEHTADLIRHNIISKLAVEFITPIDQEDILALVQIVDDITDALDEVVLECYMLRIDKIPCYAITLARKMNECVVALSDTVKELKNFKKPELLRKLLARVNEIEGEADKLYVQANYGLFGEETNVKKIISNKTIYDSLENCCDLCEHASDVIEQIVMKNT